MMFVMVSAGHAIGKECVDTRGGSSVYYEETSGKIRILLETAIKKIYRVLFVCALCAVMLSCSSKKLIRQRLDNLAGKEKITVVLVGNSFTGLAWLSDTNSGFTRSIKPELENVFSAKVSLINSSIFDDTFIAVTRRVQEDILSYRPDIVFIMLGWYDANFSGISIEAFRGHVQQLLDTLEAEGIFAVLLTAHGSRDVKSEYDSSVQRLKQFNEIVIWEAGHHNFPAIGVFERMERMRISSREEYRSLFFDSNTINDTGRTFVMKYVLNYFK